MGFKPILRQFKAIKDIIMQNLLEDDTETVVISGDFEDVSELQRDLDQELDSIF